MNLGWLQTSFAVADVARTSAFYEALGLQVVETNDVGKSRTLEAGDCRIALYQGVLDPSEAQLIFWQGDVEGCARKLIEAGAQIVRQGGRLAEHDRSDGLVQLPDGAVSIMTRDPDGQLIYLIREPGVTRAWPPASGSSLDRGFCQVSLPVKDPDRTAAFYELLGFRRRPDDDPRVAPLTNGECRICLYQGYLDPDELQLNFWQGDIDAVAATARREGLRFYREPGRDDAGAGFMLIDPDGRPVFFINMAKYSATDFISAAGEMLA
ncbi:MAG TPA: VOC family protein [Caulobacteraceae bacterium]|jgi:catechol 2,3-dioxygenase-like lactoylglutathione lyase family enzyme|nr:VOC family protein [Caulobacteraceae bacterium]